MVVFKRLSRADNSMEGGPGLKFEPLLGIMHVLCTYDFKMDQINSNQEKVATSFFRRSRAVDFVVHGQIWPNFKLIQFLMHVIITCKYEKVLIKNSREKVATISIYRDFFRLTLQSVVGSGRILKSSKLSCMSSLPVSMIRIG